MSTQGNTIITILLFLCATMVKAQDPKTETSVCHDRIIFYTDTIENVQIIKNDETEVLYRYCDGSGSTTFNINKEFIKRIEYGDGRVLEFTAGSYIKKQKKIHELSFSISPGMTIGGAKSSMMSHMSTCGFNYLEKWGGYVPGGETQYPHSKRTPVFALDVRYTIKKDIGFSLSFAVVEQLIVMGVSPPVFVKSNDPLTFNELIKVRDISELNLRSNTKAFSIAYFFRLWESRLFFTVGPSILVHTLQKQESKGLQLDRGKNPITKNYLPGLILGFWFQFLERSKWIIAGKASLHLAPFSEIGPYHGSGPQTEFTKTKINISALNIGICFTRRTYLSFK